MLVVSPYAKHDYVSHVQHELGSILHFTEKTFGLPTLAQSDGRADDLTDCFDFGQQVKPYESLPVERSPDSFAHAPEMQPPDND
jgi:phospholipase C